MLNIDLIENISGTKDQIFEIIFLSKDKKKYKLIFDHVWDMKYTTENGCIDRFTKFCRNELNEESSIAIVENSDYIKYFENQVSGTRDVEGLKNYILSDTIETVIDILTIDPPRLIEI